MKLLVVTPYYYPKIGGLENYARQLGLALRRHENMEIAVVTSNEHGRRSVIEEIDGITVYRLPYWFKVSNTPVNPLWSLMLRRIIAREHPDVIHAHSPVPTMADAAALAAGSLPFVVTYHAATLYKAKAPVFNLMARLYKLYEARTLARADKIFAVSSYVRDQLPKALRKKTVVMPNAVWAKEIKLRRQPSEERFIFIGSLDESHSWKGLEPVIQAIARYKVRYGGEPHLTVVGDGNARLRYQRLAMKLDLDQNITFSGAKVGSAKDALLSGATALVAYPTSGNDAFPTVFLEAWAKRVPVVAAAIGPIPSLIDDNVTGYLVRANDPDALAERLYNLVNDKPGRSRVATQAAKLVRAHYTWENQAQATAKELGAYA
jgi:glycosyltransferase involved in cell wall biosynthesis